MFWAELAHDQSNGLGVLVLKVCRQHLFVHVGEFLPDGAACRAPDLFHDAAKSGLIDILRKKALGAFVAAHQGAFACEGPGEL
jgi:hypothetical protein